MAEQSFKIYKDTAERLDKNALDIASLKEDLGNIISPNLYNPADAKENTAINQGNGTEMSFDGWLATGYIPVSKGEVLHFSSNGEPTAYSTGAFYDKNKQLVDSFGNPNNNNNITVTSDGYARFSFNSKREKLQIEKGSKTTYIPYGELKVKAEVGEVKAEVGEVKAEVGEVKAEVAKIQEDHSNLFNKDTVTKGAVISDSGYFDTFFSSWDSSDYIPVKPGMVLYFSSNELPIGVASTGAYFDKNKKYLSGINNEPTVLTVPDGAYYLRFSKNECLGDVLNTLKIEQHGITKFTPYGELYVTVNESALPGSILPKWKGLKILTLGDSITAMGGVNGWTYWIKQYLLADRLGAETIDTRRCGIRNIYESQTTIDYDHPEQSGVAPIQTDLLDGIHTNENGAKKIAKYNAREIMKYFMIN